MAKVSSRALMERISRIRILRCPVCTATGSTTSYLRLIGLFKLLRPRQVFTFCFNPSCDVFLIPKESRKASAPESSVCPFCGQLAYVLRARRRMIWAFCATCCSAILWYKLDRFLREHPICRHWGKEVAHKRGKYRWITKWCPACGVRVFRKDIKLGDFEILYWPGIFVGDVDAYFRLGTTINDWEPDLYGEAVVEVDEAEARQPLPCFRYHLPDGVRYFKEGLIGPLSERQKAEYCQSFEDPPPEITKKVAEVYQEYLACKEKVKDIDDIEQRHEAWMQCVYPVYAQVRSTMREKGEKET